MNVQNLVGQKFEVGNDEVTIVSAGEYHPAYEGVFYGWVIVIGDDGNEYAVTDSGHVYPCDGAAARSVGALQQSLLSLLEM